MIEGFVLVGTAKLSTHTQMQSQKPTQNLNDEARRIHMYSSTNSWTSECEPRYPSYLQNPMRTNLPQPRTQSAPAPMTS